MRVGTDVVVCGYLTSGRENFRVNCQKSAQSEFGGFGEVERPISGHLSAKASKDWYRCLHMVTKQDTEALLEVWFTA